MKRFTLLAPLFLAACGAHVDLCDRPCPDDVPPHLCDCQPFEGGGGFAPVSVVTPEAPKPAEPTKPDVKPDPKPETPKPPSKPEAPKHEPKGKEDDC